MKNRICLALVLSLLVALCFLTGCQKKGSQSTLKVAATSLPHGEILEQLIPELKSKGIDLQVIIVEDYNTPNRALMDKDVDANFFQHLPFLEIQNRELGYTLESLTGVHIEPMGLYSKKIGSLKELKPYASIAIPSDPSNQARALCLLEKENLISLNRHDSNTSLRNIVQNPFSIQFIEIDSPLLSRSLEDVQLAAITTNFALQAGLSPKNDALATEDSQSLFVNIIAIRSGESKREALQVLKKAINSEQIRIFIENRYDGQVMPAFEN